MSTIYDVANVKGFIRMCNDVHYINNSIRKFAAEIKTCGNLGIQALPEREQQNGQNNNKPRKLW